MTLVEFLEARLAEIEQWATAASVPVNRVSDSAPESGVHWRWVEGENWDSVDLDPATDEAHAGLSLVTVEEWPAHFDVAWTLPGYHVTVEEIPTVVAGHIARHDPAFVLADVAAKRRIIEIHRPDRGMDPCDAHDASYESIPCETLEILALPFSGHPDYREEWKP